MPTLILGLGGNLGNRYQNLQTAFSILARELIQNPVASPIYESSALLTPEAPAHWNKPFLNMVIAGECKLPPETALHKIKQIEKRLQRFPNHRKWAPRTIDIDILYYGDHVYKSPKLTIPHPEITKRPFVYLPLMDLMQRPEIRPKLRHYKATNHEMLAFLQQFSIGLGDVVLSRAADGVTKRTSHPIPL